MRKTLIAAIFAGLSAWIFWSRIFIDANVPPAPPLVRVGFIGDSILQGNNLAGADGSSITALATREITWARALYPNFDIDTWVDMSDALRHFDGLNAGVSGETTAQIRARVARLDRFAPQIMIVSAGVNSVLTDVSAASIEADLKAICEHYLNRKAKVILSNIRPVGAKLIPDGSAQMAVLKEVNEWIQTFATNTRDVEFWNVAAAYDDGNGRPRAGYTADELHPVSLGSQHAAFTLLPILQRLLPSKPQWSVPDNLNYFPTGHFAGDDGKPGPGVTGTLAHGIEAAMISANATTTVTASILPNPGSGGVQEFRFAPHSDDLEVFTLSLSPDRLNLLRLGGKWVKARCKITLQSWTGWRGVDFNTRYMNWVSVAPMTDTMADNLNWQLELETMPFRLPYFPRRISPRLTIYINGAGSTHEGVAQIQQVEFFQVNDPTAPRQTMPRPERNDGTANSLLVAE